MKPLQSVAMGLVIVALSARVAGYDVLRGPGRLAARRRSAWPGCPRSWRCATPCSAWRRWPAWSRCRGLVPRRGTAALYDADASLAWAANLPQIAFSALLCHALSGRAWRRRPRPARWLRDHPHGLVVVGLLPVLVFGAHESSLEVPSYLAAGGRRAAADLAALRLRRPALGAGRGGAGAGRRPS